MSHVNHRIESPEEFFRANDSKADANFVFEPTFKGTYFAQVVNYPVIVEMFDKKLHGRVRRAYHEQFTEKERATIGKYHTAFRKWHLYTGVPDRIMIKLSTVRLLVRAVQFFATI